jgi:hypothetical protein
MRTVVTTVVSELLPWISIGPLLLMGLMITLIRGSGSCNKCSACPSTQPSKGAGYPFLPPNRPANLVKLRTRKFPHSNK